MKRLTKREQDIMQVFWDSESALGASDVQKAFPEISIFTIQQVIRSLLSHNFIEVAGYARNKKALMRVYKPLISHAEFVQSTMSKLSSLQFVANFVSESSKEDQESLKEIEKMLREKLDSLSKE